MNTREERRLHAFLFERYCAALAGPNAKTRDALANALRVAHRRVRATLEQCFADENVGADERRELLTVYGALDAAVEAFWTCLADGAGDWLQRGSDLIRLVEHAHAMAIACRRAAARRVHECPPAPATEPGSPVATFEEQDTQVYDRDQPMRVAAGQTEVALG